MKSKLLIAVSALSLILALPLLAQGQGGGQWGGGQGGSFNMEDMYKRMVERAVSETDTDDDGELSKEEFLELAKNERYSIWFEEDEEEAEDEESSDDEAESEEADEATADESEEGEEESDEDALTKLHEAKFAEFDADDDGNVTVDELNDSIDFEAVMEKMRDRWQQGGGNRQRGQGGGNWQRPGGGSP